MITLKEALKLSNEEIKDLRAQLEARIIKERELGAYVEQLTGLPLSKLGEGVPIAIKDNIQIKGWSVTSGSKILQGYIAPYNATAIEKLLARNLAAFGRTNMDEFAMGSTTESSFYGHTLNPLNHAHVPGGSSGGSAAAVAGGIAIAALGSDTGGSIRQPAAFCGCVGFKPTYGRVSRYGLAAYSSSLDQIGPIAQNVEDAAILYDIIAGHDEKDSTSADVAFSSVADKINGERKLNICVIENYVNNASEDTKKALNSAIDKLKNFGHKIVYKNLEDSKYDVAAYYIIATAEASANLSRYDGVRYGRRAEAKNLKELYVNSRSEGFGEEVKRRILLGTFVLSSGYYDAYYIKAQKARAHIKAQYEKILDEADLIFMPVSPTTAPKFGLMSDPLQAYLSDIYTISVNLAGLPAISVPIAKDGQNLNISAQLIAKAWDEQTLIDGAKSLENLIKG
ncbi:Asp-tRNA(Asn)/Glu-tRNA(Gln) amidotransferase subunit GatA [Campylobacter curvus]|uniref:Glutamyl-tRNA(Gln) amidotransferase subunit A n=1 Tax=Campylobacter curvus (strain 525.92) TaxID=360105 RepID=GATA_CAMC5|nr:Asp-tRNA(Asn)/Glu-tRNA(Gln) amidotransferase subunit GatA [Campylobacter curvus]A7GX27.1 RecName: Full=Glutamyl-tRNA(Gln) amidotransferase subunit A; Short=Glu-ADT subunit A [Campylobacter curvus 525.92]EAT99856.1 Glu-tRNA(Gln) amidotransferase, subunit A [Campylobacter curvus 525.92]